MAFPALPSHAIPRFTACARSAPTRGPPAETTRLEGTVLLVDDEPRARFALSFLLRNRGLTILEAQDGLEAVEIVTARGATIDAVVMDLSMPKMGGREASVAMLARIPDLPIILTSGYSVDRLRGFPERDRILAFLEKPFHEEALVVWLERAFRLRRPADLPSITSP